MRWPNSQGGSFGRFDQRRLTASTWVDNAECAPLKLTFDQVLYLAAMESFWHTLKTERVYCTEYATKDEARRELFAFIEGFYNSHRLRSTLGYISPAEAERRTA